MSPLLIGDLGTPELLIILVIVVLVFGASKLPELARGSGRALRIFKSETKGLRDDDEATPPPAAPIPPAAELPPTTPQPQPSPIEDPQTDKHNG